MIDRKCLAALSWILAAQIGLAENPTDFYAAGKSSEDSRLGSLKTLRGYFPMQVPKTLAEWKARQEKLREQVLVGNGLWPMPKKEPLKPVIHGKMKMPGYTIEKVFFESFPGFYVTGNLYRPEKTEGKAPGVLCPHGHWPNGRFYDAGIAAAKKKIQAGEEKWIDGARNHIQARCVALARKGCIVFNYDMVGYADSMQIRHRQGFTDVEAAMRLQNFMGLQTWNSIRSLDFLTSLPGVDPKRIAVTGASGGGTQTFLLCGIDPRPTVAFPAVMVSTAMQGGCICENCSYLRVDAGNIDLAALCAPRPLGMSGARDWTVDIEKKGLPELKKLYGLYGAEENVTAKCFPQFGHNYNQVSRAVMYQWFNKHLRLGLKSPTEEKPFPFQPKAKLTVFTEKHPRPENALDAKRLREYMTTQSNKQMAEIFEKAKVSPKIARAVLRPALRVMVGGDLPTASEVEIKQYREQDDINGMHRHLALIGRKGGGDQVPALFLEPQKFDGTVVVWVHPEGKSSALKDGALTRTARTVLEHGRAILAIDAIGTGELKLKKPVAVDKGYIGYTYGYNKTLLGNRVQDILTAVQVAMTQSGAKRLHLVGFGEAGPWTMMASALCNEKVTRTIVDGDQFTFQKVDSPGHGMMLPGAWKYGDIQAMTALIAPRELLVHNSPRTTGQDWISMLYRAEKAEKKVTVQTKKMAEAALVKWLLR